MPRPGPRRPLLAFRLSDADRELIDALAAKRGLGRSELIRIMLAYAQQNMPPDWTPTLIR
jgi:hypothetical protein